MGKVILLVLVLFSLVFVQAHDFPETSVYYFHSYTCSHCANVKDSGILGELNISDHVSVEILEISDPINQGKFLSFVEGFNLDPGRTGVPFLVIEQEERFDYLMGDTPIIKESWNRVENFEGIEINEGGDSIVGDLTLGVIIIAALIDSINPCAFGVLLFLMAVLLSMGSSKRAFRAGVIYSVVIFLVYFLAGVGIMKILGSITVLDKVKMVVAIIILVFAAIEIKDFFWEGKGFSLKIPEGSKPLLEKYVRKGTIPAIFVLGALVALVELPCTGGIYLAILSLVAESGVRGVWYLAIYNLIFVLPLLVLTYAISRGVKVESLNEWTQKNKKFMRLAAGIIMVLLALYLLGVI